LVGYAGRGAELAQALAAAGRLALIAEPLAEARAQARTAHPTVHVTALREAALEPEAVDVLVLADGAHADLVGAAGAAGLAVVVVPASAADPAGLLRQVLGLPAARPAGVSPEASLHPTVVVDGAVQIGARTRVWHYSKLLGPLVIGEDCILGQNVVVERGVAIGRNVKIQNNVSVYAGVILEDDVFCGPSMVFTNVGTPRSAVPRRGQYVTTRVGQGASIGANATVVCGHQLGRYSFVGAGAVVTRDVPDHGLVYGNPARLRGWACYCGARLPMGVDPRQSESATCTDCGRTYAREGFEVHEVQA